MYRTSLDNNDGLLWSIKVDRSFAHNTSGIESYDEGGDLDGPRVKATCTDLGSEHEQL